MMESSIRGTLLGLSVSAMILVFASGGAAPSAEAASLTLAQVSGSALNVAGGAATLGDPFACEK